MKFLYKYPQRAFPYGQLVEGNRRGKNEPELELIDTDVFDDDRYFAVVVEYAKGTPEDILLRITAHNRGPEATRTSTCGREYLGIRTMRGLDSLTKYRIDFNILFTVHAANQHDPLEFCRFIRDELTWLAFRAASVTPARSRRFRRLN